MILSRYAPAAVGAAAVLAVNLAAQSPQALVIQDFFTLPMTGSRPPTAMPARWRA